MIQIIKNKSNMTALKRGTVLPEKLKKFRNGKYKFEILIHIAGDVILFPVSKRDVYNELKLIDDHYYNVYHLLSNHVMINFTANKINPCHKD